MSVQLGSAFGPALPDLVFDPVEEAQDNEVALRLDLVLAALQNLSLTLTNLPTPEVVIDAPDLSAIVTAVNGLKPGADADQIAEAVARTLEVTAQPQGESSVNKKLIDALDKLDFRLRGVGSTGHSTINLPNDATRQVGVVSLAAGTQLTSSDSRTLTERMFAKAPALNYSLYLDTADVTYIYIAEGPTADTAATASARGVRVTKDLAGNPLGRVTSALNFAWNSRASASWL